MSKPNNAEKGSYVQLALENWTDAAFLRLSLNNELEYVIAAILREHETISKRVLAWAKSLALAPGGYNSWEEIRDYIVGDLQTTREDVESPNSREVGGEYVLIACLDDDERALYLPAEDEAASVDITDPEVFETSEALAMTRRKIEALNRYRARKPDLDGNPRLFRKIYYTYKLHEALVGQVGYYNGSLELRAGLTEDFEYWMYLIQMKLRKPTRQHLFQAPKSMATYLTSPESLLPWNNQFSFSYGFHEFGTDEMPVIAASEIEHSLLEAVFDDAKWEKLVALVGWNPNDVTLTKERTILRQTYSRWDGVHQRAYAYHVPSLLNLGNLANDLGIVNQRIAFGSIMAALGNDEVAKKAFFTLVLGMTWSDELVPLEQNVFEHVQRSWSEQEKDMVNRVLAGDAIKDPRLPDDQNVTPLDKLSEARQFPNVVGRQANVLLQPSSALATFTKKLARLTDTQLKALYANVVVSDGTPLDIDEVGRQAESAANAWVDGAMTSNKPIYTGPSGHVLTYLTLYAAARGNLVSEGEAVHDLPSLEEARLVVLAALLGRNQHHSYDECMTASHAVSMNGYGTLQYMDRRGYGDVLAIGGDPHHEISVLIRRGAGAIAYGALLMYRAASQSYRETNDWYEETVRDWYHTATGQPLQQEQFV